MKLKKRERDKLIMTHAMRYRHIYILATYFLYQIHRFSTIAKHANRACEQRHDGWTRGWVIFMIVDICANAAHIVEESGTYIDTFAFIRMFNKSYHSRAKLCELSLKARGSQVKSCSVRKMEIN